MRNLTKLETSLSLVLLVLLAKGLAAQKPPPDMPDVKLPALLSAKPLKEDPKDDELRKLLKARYNAAVSEVKELYEKYKQGQGTIGIFAGSGQRLVKAALEVSEKPEEKVALLAQYVELTKELEQLAKHRLEAGAAPGNEFHQAHYQRLDAEIQLLRAKRVAKKD